MQQPPMYGQQGRVPMQGPMPRMPQDMNTSGNRFAQTEAEAEVGAEAESEWCGGHPHYTDMSNFGCGGNCYNNNYGCGGNCYNNNYQ